MAGCELCGRESNLLKVVIENARLNVCGNCSKHGKIIENKTDSVRRQIVKKDEIIEDVIENFAELVRLNREQLKISQKELALKLNEREALIAKIENGTMKPDLELAKKLGKFFKINLIKSEFVSGAISGKGSKSQRLTIGDFIKNK